MSKILLENHLEPLRAFLDQPEVSEISINKPGGVWVEQRGVMSHHSVPELSLRHLKDLAKLVATYTSQSISEEQPLLAAHLPEGYRIQFVYPPAVLDHTLGISIRRSSLLDRDLDWYDEQGALSAELNSKRQQESTQQKTLLRELYEQKKYKEFLSLAVQARANILISGGTSTGKTTFLNMLLKQIPKEERLITIEDVPEIQVRQPNALSLFASRGQQGRAQIDMQDLLEASLRLRPDRIIIGELRGAEAFSFLRAINTGHPGSIATVHADTAELAFEQLILMVMQKKLGLGRNEIENYARLIIDIVVQLKKAPDGGRYISEVYYKA